MGFSPELLKTIDDISDRYVNTHNELERLWAEKMVFTWHWWLDVALAVLPWIVWLFVRDRRRQHSLLYAGLFTMLTASLLCMLGVSQSGWNYNTLLLPYLPEYLPWDLTVMPVTTMLFFQYLPKLSPWLKGAVFGGMAAYVIEPIFIWLGMYEPSGWEHHYSLPIYFAIYMIAYWLYSQNLRQSEKRV